MFKFGFVGLRWDRNWLIVNSKGRGYTQRVEPKLALVDVELPKEAFLENWEPMENSNMVIKAPGMDSLKISLATPAAIADGISVWEWAGTALDEGEESSQWFTRFLGKPSRLVRFNASSETRPVDPKYAPGHFTRFSDMYPFLLLSQASLDALNNLLKDPVPVNRFRPNILVEGCKPFDEDLWTEILINSLNFYGVKLCSRCKVPTINQENAVAGSEPTKTLTEFRSDRVLRPDQKPQGKLYFGQNMVWKDHLSSGSEKVLRVGDLLFVLRMVSSAAEAAA